MAERVDIEAQGGGDGNGAGPAKAVTLVVITGHSGAGKSEAIAAFEDGGYFCVDNLPPRMIESLGELFRHEGSGVERAAVVCDVRGGEYFEDFVQVLDGLKGIGPVRKRALLQHFGSPERFVAATREELEMVPGVPGKLAREIHEQLNRTG